MASLHEWLVGAAWECGSPGALTAAYGQALNAAGAPVWRVQVGLRTLHPLLVAENHTWRADADGVQVACITRETVSSDTFLRSPLAPLYEGAGAIRCRLAGEHAALDYPVLHDLAAAGATDYPALPMSFSDGQLNAVTFATRDARGFAPRRRAGSALRSGCSAGCSRSISSGRRRAPCSTPISAGARAGACSKARSGAATGRRSRRRSGSPTCTARPPWPNGRRAGCIRTRSMRFRRNRRLSGGPGRGGAQIHRRRRARDLPR